jgi:hypothetical protein
MSDDKHYKHESEDGSDMNEDPLETMRYKPDDDEITSSKV